MRLIDADEFYELIDGGFDLNFDEVPETKKELLRMIEDAPTVDAVEVVRCKDCERWKREENQVGEIGEDYFCAFDCNKSYRDDFFCADGERREDASKTD